MIYPVNMLQHRIDAFMANNPQFQDEPYDSQRACDIANFLFTKERRKKLKHPSHTSPRTEQLLALLKTLPDTPISQESTNLDMILGLHCADFKICRCLKLCRGSLNKATNIQSAECVRMLWEFPMNDDHVGRKQQGAPC